ncbi:C40 family peptidase [Streptomyces sp. MUM 203J]|uniref:C40 family peptidase n=1 Tax=Streptomyces sp. MUM 203J TaxID=2791990 RepID=UPI001F035D4C|nr:C40 family peptidase [Streptomyces sp. MUM 203J]MCH0542253.1 C40 family peptidase [Streptomyces sp. MUM 203J]
MAAHRKPKQRPLTGQAGRTAATLALAGAATATVFEGSGHAEPQLTSAEVKARVDSLHHEAELATEKYNGAKEKAEQAEERLDALRDEAARRTGRLNAARDALGSTAAAQYRSGGVNPAFRLALTADPESYLRGAALSERVGARQAAAVSSIKGQLVELDRLRREADDQARELKARQDELNRHKTTVQHKLGTAEKLLARLTAAERAAYRAGPHAHGEGTSARPGAAPRTTRSGRAALPEPGTTAQAQDAASRADASGRAAKAVAFAYGAIGKPYRWGATGPSSYDCSGLTQAAWRAAGVALPRTTYSQINAGRRVARSQLAPGDLVFFYSGVSHVGIYIGDGKMIHAPRTGSSVKIASIDEMPWAGAARVG